jgi:signal transduction histidine kinase
LSEWVLLSVCYGLGFALFNRAAALWGTSHFYSLWFPGAGLRLVVLWLLGARIAPLLAFLEALAVWLTGGFVSQPDQLFFLGSVVAPPLGYGFAVFFARRLKARSLALSQTTVRFGTAAVAAPIVGFLCSAPWHLLAGEQGFGSTRAQLLGNFIIFVIGDFLGIVVIAPPLLWGIEAVRARKFPRLGPWTNWVNSLIIMGVGVSIVLAAYEAGFGVRLVPLALAVAAVGLAFGQFAVWVAVVVVAVAVVSLTADSGTDLLDASLHLQLAGIAVIGFISGSYADDQKRMQKELRAREAERLHSERLKTLRAMSVAVIHELSQPLSTLSLETKYLARLTHSSAASKQELREVADLVAQKTESVSRMLRRLRSFGEASDEAVGPISVEMLVRDVVGVVAPEARAAGVRIQIRIRKRLAVGGYIVELQQALTNLLRNAISASPNGIVDIEASDGPDDHVRVDVVNTPTPNSPYRKGMGVGKLIVEAIAEMHGGRLEEAEEESGQRRMSLFLPVAFTDL